METNKLYYPAALRPLTEEEAARILSEPKPDLTHWKESDTEKARAQPVTYPITAEDAKNPYRDGYTDTMLKGEKATESNSACIPVKSAIFPLAEQATQAENIPKMETPTPNAKAVSNYREPVTNIPSAPTVLSANMCMGAEFPGQDYGNVFLCVVADYHYHGRDGNDDEKRENEIEVQVYRKATGTLLGTMRVSYSSISQIVKFVKNKIPTATFLKDAVRDGLPEDDIRTQLSSVKVIECYAQAGWTKTRQGHCYLFKDCITEANVCTKLNLPYYQEWGRTELTTTWKILCSLYQDEDICRVLLLFIFSGVTFKLFELAEHPLEFLLFINGKTGSMKTSIAVVLYMQLVRDDMRKNPRRIDMDTGTSFERALVESGFDTVSLFDDYAPPINAGEKTARQDNFERIVRMVGDRSTKSRSNRKLEDCQGEGVHGSVVITGEVMGDGLSSNLRCLYCNIERDKVNLDSLTWLQSYKYGITTIIKFFSDYVAVKWDELVDMIRCQYPTVRQRIQASGVFTHFRTNEKYAYFIILAEIVKGFFQYFKCWRDEVSSFFGDLASSLIRTLSMGEASIEEYDPLKNFLRSFIDLMSVGKIKISPRKISFHELSAFDGFEDNDFIYVLEGKVYPKIREKLSDSLTPFYLSAKEIRTMLAEEGYTVSCPNGKGKRTFSTRLNIDESNQKIDFLKFRKERLAQLADEKEL